MPEHRWNDMEPEDRIEALSDYLDQMEEEEFDPAIVDRCLAAMEDLEPEASEFDAEEALRTFRGKHRDLIRGDSDAGQEQPELKVLPGGNRPRKRRLAARVAAVAAATAAGCRLSAAASAANPITAPRNESARQSLPRESQPPRTSEYILHSTRLPFRPPAQAAAASWPNSTTRAAKIPRGMSLRFHSTTKTAAATTRPTQLARE